MKSKTQREKPTIIFTHGDSDGICAGAIAKNAYEESDVYFTSPVNLLDKLNNMADGYDNIVICDIAVDERTQAGLMDRLNDLSRHSKVIYIDHHPLPYDEWGSDWFYHDTGSCASELTYRSLKEMLGRDIRRIAIYGAIGDFSDNTDTIRQWSKDWDKRTLYFQAGTLIQAVTFVGRDYNLKRKILNTLSTDVIPSEIPELLDFAKRASVLEEELRLHIKKNVLSLSNISYIVNANGYMSKAAIYAAAYGRKSVGISAEHRSRKDVFDLSIRSRGNVDVNRITRKASRKVGGTGGGHPMAAGARIPEKKLEIFLRIFDDMVEEYSQEIDDREK
ncbi:DHHA1 domain-containing protein [Methanosalsum zhilinae]|nr:DHHA1 domain-containing protein [Methanosalsum zhilinae]